MINGETELEMVYRHVREGSARLNRQNEIVSNLQATGGPTELAENILQVFTLVQKEHESHLKRLTELPPRPADPMISARIVVAMEL